MILKSPTPDSGKPLTGKRAALDFPVLEHSLRPSAHSVTYSEASLSLKLLICKETGIIILGRQ